MPRTMPSAKYSSTSIDAHCSVYTLRRNVPRSANSSGTALSASAEPPGRSGASQSSHAIDNAISAIRLNSAPRAKPGWVLAASVTGVVVINQAPR